MRPLTDEPSETFAEWLAPAVAAAHARVRSRRRRDKWFAEEIAKGAGSSVEPTTVRGWTAATSNTPPSPKYCDAIARVLGVPASEVHRRAAWARIRARRTSGADEERSAIDAALAALRQDLLRVTAERDTANAALRSPEVDARVAAQVNEQRAKEKATREGRAWDALLRLTRQLADTQRPETELERAVRLANIDQAEERGESVEQFEMGPDVVPHDHEPATRVVEALVAVLGTATDGKDQGRRLLFTLLRFGQVKDWVARRVLLDSFAGAVEAAYVMACRAQLGPDTRPMSEVGDLGSESVDERRASAHATLLERLHRFGDP